MVTVKDVSPLAFSLRSRFRGKAQHNGEGAIPYNTTNTTEHGGGAKVLKLSWDVWYPRVRAERGSCGQVSFRRFALVSELELLFRDLVNFHHCVLRTSTGCTGILIDCTHEFPASALHFIVFKRSAYTKSEYVATAQTGKGYFIVDTLGKCTLICKQQFPNKRTVETCFSVAHAQS